MATCIRCGKPCNDGETMCDDCKLWFQQKTGGASPVSKAQKSKKTNPFSKRDENKGSESPNNKESEIQQEQHSNNNSVTKIGAKNNLNGMKFNPKVLGIALIVVIVFIVLIVVLTGKGNDDNTIPGNEEQSSIETSDDTISDDIVSDDTDSKVEDSEDIDTDLLNINVEDEVLSIREMYNDIVEAINKGKYTEKNIAEGIKGYYDEAEIKAIIVPHSASYDIYSKSYYYNNGKLIFAYYEASDANRLYFVDEKLIRWRYSENANDPQNAENFDLVKSSDYEYWNTSVIEESNSYMQLVINGSSIQTGDYILPGSDSSYLSMNDLAGLNAEQCRLARNELYARHGRKFDDIALQNYFNQKDWYTGRIDPDDFTEDMLNDYEIHNRDLIVEYEKEQGYR